MALTFMKRQERGRHWGGSKEEFARRIMTEMLKSDGRMLWLRI